MLFFRTTPELEYLFFLQRKSRNIFPELNIRLYDKNSESDYYFFFLHQIQNIFFSNIGNQNILKKKEKTYPPPLKLNGRSLIEDICYTIDVIEDFCYIIDVIEEFCYIIVDIEDFCDIVDVIENFDTLCFTEIHLNINSTDSGIYFYGFEIPVRKGRNSHGGGIIMYYKSYINVTRCKDLEHDHVEICGLN